MQRHCDAVHIWREGSDVRAEGEAPSAGQEVLHDNTEVCPQQRPQPGREELQVEVLGGAGVAVAVVVDVCCLGEIEEEEVVIEVMRGEG